MYNGTPAFNGSGRHMLLAEIKKHASEVDTTGKFVWSRLLEVDAQFSMGLTGMSTHLARRSKTCALIWPRMTLAKISRYEKLQFALF